MPGKSSPKDTLPTSLLKSYIDVFAPVIAHLANLSFKDGCFPMGFKTAQVLPLLKKPGLDQENYANYRPISNLSTISKVIERLALVRLNPFLTASPQFNPVQSASRSAHSTETALLKVLKTFMRASTLGCQPSLWHWTSPPHSTRYATLSFSTAIGTNSCRRGHSHLD